MDNNFLFLYLRSNSWCYTMGSKRSFAYFLNCSNGESTYIVKLYSPMCAMLTWWILYYHQVTYLHALETVISGNYTKNLMTFFIYWIRQSKSRIPAVGLTSTNYKLFLTTYALYNMFGLELLSADCLSIWADLFEPFSDTYDKSFSYLYNLHQILNESISTLMEKYIAFKFLL